MANRNHICWERTIFLHTRNKLTNIIFIFVHSRKIFNFFCCLSIYNLTIWSFKESIIINLCKHWKRNNQTNIWTFRSFNRTHSSIMRIVYVSNFKTCTVTRKTTSTQSRKTTLMCKFRQRVNLIHEL